MKPKRGYYDVFVQTCAKYPSNVAVRLYENGNYRNFTYSELYGVCEYISQNIQQLNSNRDVIGVICERNVIIPCVIAAVHKCTPTFMFLNPSQNVEEIRKTLKFNTIISIKNVDDKQSTDLFNKKPDKRITIFNLDVNIYCFEPHDGINKYYVPEHSYIAMTSGSTGEPKHIQVPIECIQPNIEDLTKMFAIRPTDVIYFSTPLTFDPSMIEILLACTNGASLLIAPEKVDVLFPDCTENSVTFWQTTPSKFFQQSNIDIKNKILSANSTLKILALGGEPFNGVKRLRELKDSNNKTKIFSLYGVTEMSCWATVAELDLNKMSEREIPLGNCLSETEIVLEPSQENRDIGNIVLVSKTRKCIILNKSGSNEDTNSLKFIQTGDLGENKNGAIYYRGRKDDVIKRFGNKVSLQLVENTIMQCPRVKACSCLWLPKPSLLVVYFSSETLSSQELSDFLKCKLDDKHWPDRIVRIDNLPTNAHGKLSKRMLSQIFDKTVTTPQTLESLTVVFLKELKIILNKSFTFDEIKDMDFFSIGGTSFLAVSMCNRISLLYPQFGKFILPRLITPKTTINEIMQLAFKELGFIEKPRRKRLRSRSNTESLLSAGICHKKLLEVRESYSPVQYMIVWTYNTGKCVDASPTLFQDGFQLYVAVGSHSGKIVVIDALSGVPQGVVKSKSRIEASVVCFKHISLATSCGVVGTYDGTIVCFTLSDCKEIWRINIGHMIKSKGVYCAGFLYVASYDGKVRCIDVSTGNITGSIHIADQPISADLVLAKQQYILIGTLSGVCASVHVETKTVAWRGTLSSPVFASPVLYDCDKYVVFVEVKGEIHCRTVEKGIKIWRYQGAKGNIFSSIHITEVDRLKWQMVFGCHDHKVYSIYIKNFQPSLHWKSELSSPVYSTPRSISDKLLLAVSNNGVLCVLDSDTGSIISEYRLPNESFSTPAVYGDYIFIGCRNDYVYSIKFVLNL